MRALEYLAITIVGLGLAFWFGTIAVNSIQSSLERSAAVIHESTNR